MMSNTITTDDGIEIYANKVFAALDEFAAQQDIQDMRKCPQNIWVACMIYIGKTVFSDKSDLKREAYDRKNERLISNNDAFDLEKINQLCDLYMYLCYINDKEISISGFSKMLSIPQSYIYAWGGQTDGKYAPRMQITASGQEIYKKLTENHEESLSNMLASGSGGRAPVGIIAILNHRFGWTVPNTNGEIQSNTPDEITRDIASRHLQTDVEKPQLPDDLKLSDN